MGLCGEDQASLAGVSVEAPCFVEKSVVFAAFLGGGIGSLLSLRDRLLSLTLWR